jgi:hypothetical protein
MRHERFPEKFKPFPNVQTAQLRVQLKAEKSMLRASEIYYGALAMLLASVGLASGILCVLVFWWIAQSFLGTFV